MTSRTPGESVAHGFSQKTCLLAFTAAVRCCGRNPGGVASRTTSTPLLMTFSYASSPKKALSIFTRAPNCSLLFRRFAARSTIASSMSATAVSSLLGSAVSACAAAPLPRPPAPTRPTLTALVTVWAEMIPGNPTAMTPATAPVFLMKSRRSILEPLSDVLAIITVLPKSCSSPVAHRPGRFASYREAARVRSPIP